MIAVLEYQIRSLDSDAASAYKKEGDAICLK